MTSAGDSNRSTSTSSRRSRRCADTGGPPTTSGGRDRPPARHSTCSTRNSAAATSILRRAGCGHRARATTPSARRVTRATPPSPPRCGPTDPALLHYRSGGFFLARAAQVRRQRPAARRAARHGRRDRGADLRRAAQGVRPPRSEHHPADLDHRLAPAAGGRRGVLHRAGQRSWVSHALGPATHWRCAVSVTRR